MTEFFGKDRDLLITVCWGAKESCPMFLGRVERRRHWPIDDPAAARGAEDEVLSVFRRARDGVRGDVEKLLREQNG